MDWLVTQLKIVGGAESMVRSCAPRLRAAGWDLRILTLVSGGELVEELRESHVPVLELDLHSKAKIGAILVLFSVWKKNRPDLLHTHLFHAGLIGRTAGRIMGISPVVVHQHGPEFDRSGLRSRLDRLTSRWVTRYVASCQAVATTMQARESIPSSEIEVIHNGVDVAHRSSLQKPASWPAREGVFTLACTGRLSPEKGHLTLIESMSLMKASGYNFQCLVFGDGPARVAILEQIHQCELDQEVFLLGMRRDVQDWLPHCDLFVLPSVWEGVSVALLEAMAAGLPVIATACGGTPEIVQDGISGKLVSHGDPVALSRAIIQLLDSEKLRSQMGGAGRQRVNADFRIDQTVDKLSRLYLRLLKVDRDLE